MTRNCQHCNTQPEPAPGQLCLRCSDLLRHGSPREATAAEIRDLNIPALLNDPTLSYALKSALRDSLTRDPLDALHDARLLLRIADKRWNDCQRLDPISLMLTGRRGAIS